MKLDIYCSSDKGLVRDNNQDMVAAGFYLTRDASASMECTLGEDDRFILAVSDGMGGHGHGELASSFTLNELRTVLYSHSADWSSPENMIVENILRICRELNLKSEEMKLEKPMGCTLSGIVWAGGRPFLVNVGDSRTYRLRNSMLRLLTHDQNLLERDMVPLPRGKALYSCIGGGIIAQTEISDLSGRMLESDRLLICSDGLTDMVSDSDIEVLLEAGSPSEAGARLSDAAMAAGGRDNISLIVADIKDGNMNCQTNTILP